MSTTYVDSLEKLVGLKEEQLESALKRVAALERYLDDTIADLNTCARWLNDAELNVDKQASLRATEREDWKERFRVVSQLITGMMHSFNTDYEVSGALKLIEAFVIERVGDWPEITNEREDWQNDASDIPF